MDLPSGGGDMGYPMWGYEISPCGGGDMRSSIWGGDMGSLEELTACLEELLPA